MSQAMATALHASPRDASPLRRARLLARRERDRRAHLAQRLRPSAARARASRR
jgi:hypothetical protein